MTLLEQVRSDLQAVVPAAVRAAAEELAETPGAMAVLFYGSVLRTNKLDDVLDFYVLIDGAAEASLRGTVSRTLWPDVGWRELGGAPLIRAKVATMPFELFDKAAAGRSVDTTIWARFTQPCRLVWARSAADRDRAVGAVANAVVTAGRFAAVLGPPSGTARDYWQALFAETYQTEFRVERSGRSAQIIDHDPARYDALLPMAWEAGGVRFRYTGGRFEPSLSEGETRDLTERWLASAAAGRPLNVARLVKAAFTFQGAARYALWKVERHTGVRVPLTRWRERHPVLAAPGVLWRLYHARTR